MQRGWLRSTMRGRWTWSLSRPEPTATPYRPRFACTTRYAPPPIRRRFGKALPKRRNIVVTSRPLEAPGVESVRSIDEALALAGDADVWFIGGARIYEEAMSRVDVIDVTYVPEHVDVAGAARAPAIDERIFEPGPLAPIEGEPGLMQRRFQRRK